MPVLIIDQNNMVYRALAGFPRGEHPITYTYFLMLRKLVERHNPTMVYIVKEGRPVKRHEAFADYKAGRPSQGSNFWRQHGDITTILEKMPVHVVRHPLRECDDTIAHLVRVVHKDDECIVASNDTDFIQLLTLGDDRVKLWNPMKEDFVTAPPYDYVRWKSFVGDGTDGIPGFRGVGGKTAEKLLSNPEKLEEFLSRDDHREKFERNLFLIGFHAIEDEIERSSWSPDWDFVKSAFEERSFASLLKEKTWSKFTNTFKDLK